ncbi:MAG: hypothetical protein IPN76_26080 [Saprospiraceae bacterium]|nr:hypothetical protein [Saprospiraceae bacterium]
MDEWSIVNVANGQTVSVAPNSTTSYSIISAQDANGCPATIGTNAIVSVADNIPPMASCKTGLSLSLDASQSAQLIASTVNNASSDNYNGSLQFSFSSNPSDDNRTFDCSNLGNNLVELWVTDGDGNSNSCQTTIAIQDNQGFCTTNYPVFSTNNLIASTGSNVCLDVTVSDFKYFVTTVFNELG